MTLKFLGTTDTVVTCECCGRTNLKKTVALDDGFGVRYYGTACAARALGKTTKAVKKLENSVNVSSALDLHIAHKMNIAKSWFSKPGQVENLLHIPIDQMRDVRDRMVAANMNSAAAYTAMVEIAVIRLCMGTLKHNGLSA